MATNYPVTNYPATKILLSSQWRNPADILSVLLIIGGDVIQKAIAQLSGDVIVPVAFSFGWVAYSFTTLMAVVGDGHLMPVPDHPAKVFNAVSGYKRENKSWILGRVLRDRKVPLNQTTGGFFITVYKAIDKSGCNKDWYWASGVFTIVLQLAIAVIPWGLHSDWGIFQVTLWGTAMALLTGFLPQWRFEKWACRKKTSKTLILTGGNGTRHVMVILGEGKGLDLEDLAAAESPRMRRREEILCLLLAASWFLFLITVAGLKDDAWFLLLIGALGMVQNVVVAGASRGIGTTGLHLEEIETIQQFKVMDALMDLELKYRNVGRCLLSEFFNAKLKFEENEWWDGGNKSLYDDVRRSERPKSLRTETQSLEEKDDREFEKRGRFEDLNP